MAIPEVIPHLQTIPELVETETLSSSDWFVVSHAGVTIKISKANLATAIGGGGSSSDQIGDIKLTMNPTNPTGWVDCDNSSYSTATYPAFYALFGYTWGNDAGNFRVPDYRGRSPMGVGTGIQHIAPTPTDPLTARAIGTYYGVEEYTGSDNPTVTIGNTTVTGSISINSFTPSGNIVVSTPTFTGTPAVLTGTANVTDPGHTHTVQTVPISTDETAGVSVAIDDTYTTSSNTTGVTVAIVMDSYTPAGTISTPTASFTGNLVSPTGTMSTTAHNHTASITQVDINSLVVHPVTISRFIIKIE